MASRRGVSRTRAPSVPRAPSSAARASRGRGRTARPGAWRGDQRPAGAPEAARRARNSPGRSPRIRPQRSRRRSLGSVEEILARQPWELLSAPLLRAGVDVAEAIACLRHYAQLLLEWNRSVSNILSHNDEARIVERHLLESLTPAHWLMESGCVDWLDFGSGAGLPAIPLAIAGVGARWTLVESRRTKTLFLRNVIRDSSLNTIEVVHGRLENLASDAAHARAFDGFTSRATLRLGPTLELAAPLVRPGGSAFLWKGSGREREMAGDQAWRRAWEFANILEVGGGPSAVARFIRMAGD